MTGQAADHVRTHGASISIRRRQATVQAAPLTEKAAGSEVSPVCAPLNPIDVEAPGGSVAFQDSGVAVTACPLCAQVADHPGGVIRWPPGSVKVSVHPDSAADPVLVTPARP